MSREFSDVLVITDMDGTFLGDDKNIPQGNLEAKEKLESLGANFTIATGRTILSIQRFIDIIKPKIPMILFNGAVIYDFNQSKILWKKTLDSNIKESLKIVLEKYPQVGSEILIEDKIYIIQYNNYVKRHVSIEGLDYEVRSIDDVPEGWYKVFFALDENLMDEFIEFVGTLDFGNLTFVRSELNYYEILPEGVNKGDALLKLTEMIGIDMNNVVSIGDYNNDIEMVKESKLGFATQNATNALKDVADKITSTNNNCAVANVINYVIENKDTF
jgi:Cof subfamily protein (haloacid dehalogenase superfamily)